MKIIFSSKRITTSNSQKNNIKMNNNITEEFIHNNDFGKKTISKDQNMNKNPKNLADFFNGEIIDIND